MDTQKRYTDGELITLLRILASDRNMKPTQRDILNDDRLPTHHTFNKRFGSVQNALGVAGLAELKPSGMHHTVKSIFEHYGIEILEEYCPSGPIVVDFIVKDIRGAVYNIDVVDLGGIEIELEVSHMRRMLSDAYSSSYIQIRSVGDAVEFVNKTSLSGDELVADIADE